MGLSFCAHVVERLLRATGVASKRGVVLVASSANASYERNAELGLAGGIEKVLCRAQHLRCCALVGP